MGTATRQQEVLEELRRQIHRIERRPARREGFLTSGRPEVDALLPDGGFPRGALSALSGGPASGKTGVALSALREAQATSGALVAFVDGRGDLYARGPPRGARDRDRDRDRGARDAALPGLWAAEVLLASGAFAAVAIDVPLHDLPASRAEAMLRRLRAAAEKGGAAALLLAAPGGPAIPAALRLDLDGARLRPALRAVGSGEDDGHGA
jgi:hypothetical protein